MKELKNPQNFHQITWRYVKFYKQKFSEAEKKK